MERCLNSTERSGRDLIFPLPRPFPDDYFVNSIQMRRWTGLLNKVSSRMSHIGNPS